VCHWLTALIECIVRNHLLLSIARQTRNFVDAFVELYRKLIRR